MGKEVGRQVGKEVGRQVGRQVGKEVGIENDSDRTGNADIENRPNLRVVYLECIPDQWY